MQNFPIYIGLRILKNGSVVSINFHNNPNSKAHFPLLSKLLENILKIDINSSMHLMTLHNTETWCKVLKSETEITKYFTALKRGYLLAIKGSFTQLLPG